MTQAHKPVKRHSWRGIAITALIGPLIGLGACAGLGGEGRDKEAPANPHLGADFGNAVSHNAAQHVIDPTPQHMHAGAPPMDGARAAAAVNRYREGKVTKLDAVETTDFGTRHQR